IYAEDIEKFIAKQKGIDRILVQTLSPDDTPETKLRKLYARTQQIRYLSYERSRTEKEQKQENLKENESVEDVLKRGYAFANEINLVFVGLCRAAGFAASVVMVASRDTTIFRPALLDASQLNA